MAESTPSSLPEAGTDPTRYIQAYRWMLLARLLDEKFAALYRGGKITGGVFLGKGQEAVSAALGMALQKEQGDTFAPLIRDQAGRLAFGEPVLDAVRTYLGSRLGPMRGRDGNVHRGRPSEGLLPMISHLGSMISVVSGILMAQRFQGKSGMVGASCIGEGGTSTGSFHEALNQAAVEKLPLVMVVANNQYAYSTPTSYQYACEDISQRAIGYGIRGHSVDGTQLGDCLSVMQEAVGRARAGEGPQLVVATLLRLAGHGEHDDAGYIDPALKTSPLGQDCLTVAAEAIRTNGWACDSDLATWRTEILKEIEEAVATAQRDPLPDPNTETWQALSSAHLMDGFAVEHSL